MLRITVLCIRSQELDYRCLIVKQAMQKSLIVTTEQRNFYMWIITWTLILMRISITNKSEGSRYFVTLAQFGLKMTLR